MANSYLKPATPVKALVDHDPATTAGRSAGRNGSRFRHQVDHAHAAAKALRL